MSIPFEAGQAMLALTPQENWEAAIMGGGTVLSILIVGLAFRRRRATAISHLDDESIALPIGLLVLWFGAVMCLLSAALVLVKRFGHFSEDQQRIVTAAIGMPVTAFVVWYANAAFRPQGPRRMGVRIRQIPIGFLHGIIGFIATLPWVFWMNILTVALLKHWHSNAETEHEIFQTWVKPGGDVQMFRIAAVVAALFASPIAEETAFRGLLHPIIRQITRQRWPAVVVTAFLFAFIHQPWAITPSIFILAIGLGIVYEKTRNLWAVIVMHALFNSIEFAIFYFVGVG